MLTCVEVDHKLEDRDATDIPDDVNDVVNCLFDSWLWQFWLLFLLSFLQKLDKVLCEVLETLVATVLILELVALITFIEQIGTGDTTLDEEFIVFAMEVLWSLLLIISGGITHTDGTFTFLCCKFDDELLPCLVCIWLPWFKHSPESLWQVFLRFSLLLNAKKRYETVINLFACILVLDIPNVGQDKSMIYSHCLGKSEECKLLPTELRLPLLQCNIIYVMC